MMTPIQSVINNSIKIINKVEQKILVYMMANLFTLERKNYQSMARSCEQEYRAIYVSRDLANPCIDYLENKLIEKVQTYSTHSNPGKLIIDFTMILKPYSYKMDGTTYDRDGCLNYTMKGFSIGVVSWTNGCITIPCGYQSWFREKDVGDLYRKKTEIVQDLISYYQSKIPFDEILLDGAFASKQMLEYYLNNNLKFTVRIPKNRKITTTDGECAQLQKHSSLYLKRNQKFKSVRANIQGMDLFFTAHKRKGNRGKKEVVFIVSNVDRAAKKAVDTLKIRDKIEKCFRSSKQYLGLKDCQSTSSEKQKMHILSTMYLYACLQILRHVKKKKNIEEIVHIFRRQKLSPIALKYALEIETIIRC